jgi:hypothetical protein
MNTNFKADYYRMTGAPVPGKIKIAANILLRHISAICISSGNISSGPIF